VDFVSTSPASRVLALNGLPAIASGRHRHIFEHPRRSDCLVKVMIADAVQERYGAGARWYRRLRRAQQYAGFVREFKEYVALRARFPTVDLPIAAVSGLAETDCGLGLLVEAVRGDDGRLAPTLDALLRQHGFAQWIEEGLEQCVARLLEYNVILGDLNRGNIVFGSGWAGRPRFIVIDGFGESNLIPYCTMSRSYNQRHTRRLYRRMLEKLRAQFGGSAAEAGPAAQSDSRSGS
jgi:PhoP regulatory network protein YrbL